MFVPCPHCQFLVAHHPQLRPLPAACPRCNRLLQDAGADTDTETELATGTAGMEAGNDEGGLAAQAPEGEMAGAAASVTEALPTAETAPASGTDTDTGTAPAAASDAPMPADSVAAAPGVLTRPGRGPWRWQWPLVAALAILLPLQALLADRDRLGADARWRPLLETVCGVLRCQLPAWRQPDAFSMLDRKVRPAAPGTLRVDATFRNDARWAQPWPALQLALADADGRTLGSGVFAPEQYLGHAPDALLSPGQSAQVTFVVQEPAPGTEAFSFQFH